MRIETQDIDKTISEFLRFLHEAELETLTFVNDPFQHADTSLVITVEELIGILKLAEQERMNVKAQMPKTEKFPF